MILSFGPASFPPPPFHAILPSPHVPKRKQNSHALLTLRVNGQSRNVDLGDPETPLLYVLRDDLHLRGPKFGCGLGQCGACTVIVDGQALRSCIDPPPPP